MEEILHSITAAGYRHLQGRGLSLLRYDSLVESFPDAWHLEDGRIVRRYTGLESVDPVSCRLLKSGRLVAVSDTDGQTERPPLPATVRAYLGMPVTAHGVPWGVLYVTSPTPCQFAEDEMAFTQSVARQVGIFAEESYSGTGGNVELATVRVLAATVDAKDPYTRNHSTNVAFFARRVAREMKLDPVEVHRIDLAGLLHDVGKVAIPDQILQKPGGLSPEERLMIQTHAAIGANILAQASHLRHLVPLVRHHHEWYDGTGYPDGLRGGNIPLGAAIISLADAFDVMTTARVYRSARSLEAAMGEIRRYRGIQFHPDAVDALEAVVARATDTAEPWLLALGVPQNVTDLSHWQEMQEPLPQVGTLGRDPLDFLVEARQIQQAEHLPAVLERAAELCRNFWSADAVQIYLSDAAGTSLRLARSSGSEAAGQFLAACRDEGPLPMAQGLMGWAALSNQGITLSDARRDPRWPYHSAFAGPVSVLVAPIMAGGGVLGVLQAVAQGESRFGRTDVKVMRVFCSLLGQAMQQTEALRASRDTGNTDHLTGLLNANYLSLFLDQCEAGLHQGPTCIAFLDSDDLKQSNDRHGHEIGNLILQHIARCLSAYRRPEDLVIRYAGDEFVLIFPGLSLPEAGMALEQIRMKIAETPIALSDGEAVNVSVSCGVTEVVPEMGAHRAMRVAAQAMYNAKRTGKNRVWTAMLGVS